LSVSTAYVEVEVVRAGLTMLPFIIVCLNFRISKIMENYLQYISMQF